MLENVSRFFRRIILKLHYNEKPRFCQLFHGTKFSELTYFLNKSSECHMIMEDNILELSYRNSNSISQIEMLTKST